MSTEVAIDIQHISKEYKIYEKKADMVREAVGITKKKYYTSYYALQDVSLKIMKGETLGIIGENGAGKSTLLKILTGVTTPTNGSIAIKGKISALLELGAGFNPNYTGVENIYLNGTMMGFTRKEMELKLDQIISFADIGEFIYQPVKNYSSGMFARLAFAVAINVEPEVLIVDEALSVGDIFFQNKCFRKIEELRDKGVTILYVSHDLASVKEMCDRVLWLEKGNVKMLGNCVEVCNEYSNALLRNKDEMYNITEQKQVKDLYITKKIKMMDIPPIQYTNESIISESVVIKSCYFSSLNGVIKNNFKQGEDCRFSVIIDSVEKINKGIIGFSIANVKGVWILNENTLLEGQRKHVVLEAGKRYKVDFYFKIPALMAGEYVVEVAVCDGEMQNYKTYAWLYNVLHLSVETDEKQYGLLNVDTDVKVFEVDWLDE